MLKKVLKVFNFKHVFSRSYIFSVDRNSFKSMFMAKTSSIFLNILQAIFSSVEIADMFRVIDLVNRIFRQRPKFFLEFIAQTCVKILAVKICFVFEDLQCKLFHAHRKKHSIFGTDSSLLLHFFRSSFVLGIQLDLKAATKHATFSIHVRCMLLIHTTTTSRWSSPLADHWPSSLYSPLSTVLSSWV